MLFKDYDTLQKRMKIFDNIDVPTYVINNLKMPLRPYQEEAYKRFIYYLDTDIETKQKKNKKLLFHMATGSGKTLLMTELMLELYVRGYRDFLFFVNSNNILDKTKDNFTNPVSSKYLFADSVKINDKTVNINSADNFDESNPDDINICFTTVQGLHSRMNNPRENSLTEEDFEDKKIVLIADEAHHIMAWTKRGALTNDEKEDSASWEETINNKIFLKNSDNILLEFTATVDVENSDVAKEYEDKIIFDYSLKQFRLDGYSKEIFVMQSNLNPVERVMQALILSQYRLKLADSQKLGIKPVVLLKSKTIKDSESFYTEFYDYLKNIKNSDIQKIQNASIGTAVGNAFDYFKANNITNENLILELQSDFAEERAVQVNSKSQSEEKQILINSLEAENNPIRLIFAVDMLDEGWDVLNLFDIVRLYDTRDSKDNKVGKTTMREAQLIGRGARYCPFIAPEKPEMDKYKRKYDYDNENQLAVLETLYYHSTHNPKYITEIKQALREIGVMPELEPVKIYIKDSFKQTEFYKNGLVYTNTRIKNKREDKHNLSDYVGDNKIINYPIPLVSDSTKQDAVLRDDINFGTKQQISEKNVGLEKLGFSALQYALDNNSFFTYKTLKRYIPTLPNVKAFIEMDLYNIKVKLRGVLDRLNNLTIKEKKDIASFVVSVIESEMKRKDVEFKGTKQFIPKAIKDIFTDKTFIPNGKSWKEYAIAKLHDINLFEKEWLVYNDNYGTDEEQALIAYFSGRSEEIKQKYSEFYLIRNERQLKIFNFDDGKATEPDFLLFTLKKDGNQNHVFQIFLEPKGDMLLEKDKWKEDLLESIEGNAEVAHYGVNNYYYKLFGTPFFNVSNKENEFDEKIQNILGE